MKAAAPTYRQVPKRPHSPPSYIPESIALEPLKLSIGVRPPSLCMNRTLAPRRSLAKPDENPSKIEKVKVVETKEYIIYFPA